ncbi:dolichyl-phosphate-mannose-proteinmannosyltransfe rase [Haloferax gibbonsii ATCC 33959]|uniref:Dolichyl-phosphate-mannose-proteinmannosyltransfe rase n=1 Tax=Haloferax gibbonsii (strain ATCC 33959 / DSM 4427 / JCM 8863 / NBRC 102184 / NCIMB 2188 / Ma 2.38) TaxID=1227459 RepID=M0H436_HALGM|nr:flippase activity-associated protein Agl23 [Haloferax gibbonsii]ELZ77869.1 dolichyl-phosphate-mannose-proteinmannosyltransfe rase [Haloferax gibbonsii ATCC 33959]
MIPSRVGRRPDRTTLAVVALAAAALVVRLVGLGDRPLHWDEARVGYWSLRSLETGFFSYRPVAGGPLVYHLSRPSLALFGATDFALRLPFALFGAALPLAALLFRGRLAADETVGFAAVLAANPILVYYGRFARGDVLAVGFALVAFGFAVRLVDGAGRRNAYGLAAAVALAVASSGLGVVALGCLAVAGLLVFDHAALLPSARPAAMRLGEYAARLRGAATPAARALLVFVGLYVFAFAPRAGDTDGAGLYTPGTILGAIDAALFGSVRRFVGVRVVDRYPEGTHEYLPYFGDLLGALALAALPVVLLGAAVFLVDRYTAGGPRSEVSAAVYWAGASLAFVPMLTEVSAPWLGVYVVVPLALPAGIGLAALVRWGRSAFDSRDVPRVAAAVIVLLALVAQTGAVATTEVYGPSDRDTELAHFAQPSSEFSSFRDNLSAWVGPTDDEGPEVLYYGSSMYVADGAADYPPVPDPWGEQLPMAWYVERIGADSTSAATPEALESRSSVPPVVIAPADERGTVAPLLDGYVAHQYDTGLWGRPVVVFVKN